MAEPVSAAMTRRYGARVTLITGALIMAFGVGSQAPHGGIFVLFAVDNIAGFLIALVAGVLVAAALVIVLKTMGRTDADVATV